MSEEGRQASAPRRYIVTGAAEGSLGFATALGLLEGGAEVTVTRRSGSEALVGALETASSGAAAGRVHAHDLDLAHVSSVVDFARWYAAERRWIDGLVNNAGIHLDLMARARRAPLSADGFELHWRTNYLGTFHLTQQMIPLLRRRAGECGESRVVNVVSMLHRLGRNSDLFEPPERYNSWRAYGNSKLAVVHLTTELHRRFGTEGLVATCLHPGSVRTNVAGKGLEGHRALLAIREAFAPIEARFLRSPAEGARCSIACATSDGIIGGRYYRDGSPAQPSRDAHDEAAAARLWDETLAWVEGLPLETLLTP